MKYAKNSKIQKLTDLIIEGMEIYKVDTCFFSSFLSCFYPVEKFGEDYRKINTSPSKAGFKYLYKATRYSQKLTNLEIQKAIKNLKATSDYKIVFTAK